MDFKAQIANLKQQNKFVGEKSPIFFKKKKSDLEKLERVRVENS